MFYNKFENIANKSRSFLDLKFNFEMSYILGISAYYHDSAVTLIKDGEILVAVQEIF